MIRHIQPCLLIHLIVSSEKSFFTNPNASQQKLVKCQYRLEFTEARWEHLATWKRYVNIQSVNPSLFVFEITSIVHIVTSKSSIS